MSDYLVSLIRTWVPVAVGVVITWLSTWLGVPIDSTEAAMALTGLVIAVYYGIARKLEERYPIVGVFLGNRKTPVYDDDGS